MSTKYTHTELNQDVHSIAGCYCPQKEVWLKINNREIFYVMGRAEIQSSCCASGQWQYAIVPGYVCKWQGEKNANGLPVSEVEPVTDKKTRDEITRIIQEQEGVSQIEFW